MISLQVYYLTLNTTVPLSKHLHLLNKENGRMLQAAAMAFQLANIEASKNASPMRVKKLYILAGHLYSQNSVEGSRSRESIRCWRAGAAQAWCARAASLVRARAPRADAALRAAARLRDAMPQLHTAQHLQAWCTIAAISIQAKSFDLCSKAFIKLEAMNPEVFESLAVEVFTRHRPKDVKGNKIECPNCEVSMPEWMCTCPGCSTQFPVCAVSGRALLAAHTTWHCGACGATAQQHELVLRHSCPMCHAQL